MSTSKAATSIVSIGNMETVSTTVESALFIVWQTIAEPHWLVVVKQTSTGSIIPSMDKEGF